MGFLKREESCGGVSGLFFFSLFITSLFLQACSGTPLADTSTVEPSVSFTTLQKIKERGELVFVTRSNAGSYFVWRGIRMGFDYDLAKLFAAQLGVKLRIVVPEGWNEILGLLENGEADQYHSG